MAPLRYAAKFDPLTWNENNSLEVHKEVVEAAPVEGLHPAVGDASALVEEHLSRLQSHFFCPTVVIWNSELGNITDIWWKDLVIDLDLLCDLDWYFFDLGIIT